MRTSVKGVVSLMRLACAGALLASLWVVLGVSAAPAGAATYPPPVCAMISVSTTTPRQGQTITVTGEQFKPNTTVKLWLTPRSDFPGSVSSAARPAGSSVLLATVTTDSSGSFSAQVTIPLDVSGHQVLSADGPGKICPAEPIQITVSGGAGGGSSSGGNGGPPAMTGVDVALLVGIGAALLAAGVLFTQSGRRRSRHATHH